MIRAIIFDIGNVLVRFDFARVIQRLEQIGDATALLRDFDPIRHEYECGGMGRVEFVGRAKAALGFTGTDTEFTAAYEDIFTENVPMTQLVPALQKRYPLFLLSNTSDLHIEYLLRTYPVFGHFSDAVYSYLARCTKPARGIYEQALRQFPVNPRETLFIDDMEANVSTALEFGLRAIRYDYRQHDSFLATLAEFSVET